MAVKNVFGWAMLAVLGSTVCYLLWVVLTFDYKWANIWPHRMAYVRGLGLTVLISLGSLVLSSAIGVLLMAALLQRGDRRQAGDALKECYRIKPDLSLQEIACLVGPRLAAKTRQLRDD